MTAFCVGIGILVAKHARLQDPSKYREASSVLVRMMLRLRVLLQGSYRDIMGGYRAHIRTGILGRTQG